MPGIDLLIPFLVTGLALNVAPGPDMAYVASTAARLGWRSGIAASAGIFLGCTLHIMLATAGLAGVLASTTRLFTVLRYVGAAYLLYIAIGILRASPSPDEPGAAAKPRGIAILGNGVLINASNPK